MLLLAVGQVEYLLLQEQHLLEAQLLPKKKKKGKKKQKSNSNHLETTQSLQHSQSCSGK